MKPPLRLVEVGPRDGLQNEARPIPLDAKVAFIDALSRSGLREIECGAFVKPSAIPQMADSARVFKDITRRKGVVYSALVPNEQGLDRALEAEVDKIAVFTAASETFNQRNINAGIADSIERFRPVVARARKAKLPVRAYVSTAFHCPYEGPVAPGKAAAVVDRLLALGVTELSIGDTIGRASPPEVRRLLDLLLKRLKPAMLFLHFHDTYGMAVSNALTAWEHYGISGFDASSGGLGGCPYAPGASGNAAMEDLAFAFAACGGKTGVDLAKIQEAVKALEPHLGHPVASRLSKISPKRPW